MSGIDRARVRAAFARAARDYDAHAVLQREVRERLLENLALARVAPAVALDLGCGTGHGAAALRRRWPRSEVIALDLALPMLLEARRVSGWWPLRRPLRRVAGDALALPLADASIDLVFSNLCLQWIADLPRALDELRRVMRPGALLLFTSFGPRTLEELRVAWAAADATPHVAHFVDLPAIGDALLAAGFRDPVVDLDTLTLTYADARQLMRELKSIGAGNADAARARGLTGKGRLARVLDAYEKFRRDGVLPATYEVISAQAFAPEPGQPRRVRGGELASFDVARLRGSRIAR